MQHVSAALQYEKVKYTVYQGSPHYGPQAKSDLRSHFTRPQNTFCQ